MNLQDLQIMNIDTLAQYYLKTREFIKQLEEETKQKVEEFLKIQTDIETALNVKMTEQGLQNVKTSAGLLYFTTKTQVRKTDGLALLNFCKERNDFSLMQLTPLKSEVVNYVQATGTVPPGVDYQTFKELAFRKG